MELDDKAIRFLKQAKDSGLSKEEAFNFLQEKGYDLDNTPTRIAPQEEQYQATTADIATSALKGASLGFGNPLMAAIAAGTEKIQGSKTPFGELVGEYGNAIEDRQQEFARRNPKTQFIAETAGLALNLPLTSTGGQAAGGALKILGETAPKIAKNIIARGAVQGAGFSLPYAVAPQLIDISSGKKTVKEGFKDFADGTIAGTALGAGIPLFGRGIAKIIGTKSEAGRQASKILSKAKDRTIEEIVRTDKGTAALQSAVKSNDKIASQVRYLANRKIEEGADRTAEIVKKNLGFENIQEAKAAAIQGYENIFNKYGKKDIFAGSKNNALQSEAINNPTVKEALNTAKRDDLLGEIAAAGDNSLLAAQRTKEVLDDMLQKSKVAGNFGLLEDTNLTRQLAQIRSNFINKIDEIVPEYKALRTEYQNAKNSSDLLDKLIAPVGRERANSINALLTNKNKKIVAEVYGSDKAHSLFYNLRKQGIENDRFNKLYSAAEQKLTIEPSKKRGLLREAVESTGSMIGQAADMATFKRQSRMRKNIADILLGNKKPMQSNDKISKYITRGAIITNAQGD